MLDRFPIRWRLAVTSALLTFVILGVFAAVIGELTTRRVRSDFSSQLVATTDTLAQRLRVELVPQFQGYSVGRVEPQLDTFAAAEHATIRLVSSDGIALKTTTGAPDLGFPSPGGASTVGGYRVAARSLPNTNENVYVQYARPLSSVDATVRRVRAFLFFGVLAGTAIALGAGLILARRAMSPIQMLTRTTREITATRDPNRRVPIPRSEDEVSELARTLDGMLVSLEGARAESADALVRQRQFVADASHELRTPLTSVYANLELLTETLDGEEQDAAASALRSTQRMKRLVGDLLLLARADARRDVPHVPVDLARVVVNAVAELEPVTHEHELHVETDGQAMVSGVRDDLHRLVLNLVQNAIAHTASGTHVSASSRIDGEHVVVEIVDDGQGIDPEIRERLFERFVRGSGDRGGSTGLGLAIVKAVTEDHGGSVEVADAQPEGSLLARGTRFTVRIPRLAEDPDATLETRLPDAQSA